MDLLHVGEIDKKCGFLYNRVSKFTVLTILEKTMEKATRQTLKDHNMGLVLHLILERDGISRAEIARRSGLTKTTVSEIVANLIEQRFVIEGGTASSESGKPPTQLSILDSGYNVVCLDLSASEFRGAVADLRGNLVQRMNIPVQGLNGAEALQRALVLADRLTAASNAPVLGIGVGTPGLVDPASGAVHRAVNLGWENVPLQALLQERSKAVGNMLPVYVANDCHAAALAEFRYGGHSGSNNLVVVKSGRGIGAGIVINRQLFAGDGWGTGEIGHLKIVPDGEICSCGNHGCLETVASNRAIARRAIQAGRIDSLLAERPANELFLRLIEGYRQGDLAIQRIVQEASQAFGTAIAHLITILNIHNVVISGEVTTFGEVLHEHIHQEIHQRALPGLADQAEVSFSRLGSDIVMRGAAALVMSKELALP